MNNITQQELVMRLQNIATAEAQTFHEAVKLRTALADVEFLADRSDVKIPRSVIEITRFHVYRQLEVHR